MKTTKHGWTVIDEQAGVLSFTYSFGSGLSNSFTAKLPSGGLMVVSPPSTIAAEAIDELAAHGPVEVLVANNGFHHMGLGLWRERFPEARCFAAPQAAKRIAKKAEDAGELEPLTALVPLLGEGVAVVEAPANKLGETWARVKIEGGYAWYASDVLANIEQLPPKLLPRMIFKLSKSAPGYRVFHLALKFMVKDKKQALRGMLDDLREHPPTVMVPAHGAVLAGDSLAEDTQRLIEAAL